MSSDAGVPPPSLFLRDLSGPDLEDLSPPLANVLEVPLSGVETSLPAPQPFPSKTGLH